MKESTKGWIAGGIVCLVLCVFVICILFVPVTAISIYRIPDPNLEQLAKLEQGYGDNVEWIGIGADAVYPCASVIGIRIKTTVLTSHAVGDYFKNAGVRREFVQNIEVLPFWGGVSFDEFLRNHNDSELGNR